jgi:hypothetical protein
MGTSSNFTVPGGPVEDFWRSANNTAKPDGTTDTTDGIVHNGKASVGSLTTDPVATLEVSDGARSGTHGNIAGTPLYVTGPLPELTKDGVQIATSPVGGVEFRANNGTQGIGIGYNGLYATGSSANQKFSMMNKGNGSFYKNWQNFGAGGEFLDAKDTGVAAVANSGHKSEFRLFGQEVADHYEAWVQSTGPLQIRQAFTITTNGALTLALRIQPDLAQLGNTSLYVGENRLNNRKIVLFDGAPTSPTEFWGQGINGNTYRNQIPAYVNEVDPYHYSFFTGINEIFRIHGQGAVTIDPAGINPGNGTTCLKFGGHLSGEIILSKRTAGGNQNALSFFTTSLERFTIKSNGRINMAGVPIFASNAAAITGGLVAGDLYRSATGVLNITF